MTELPGQSENETLSKNLTASTLRGEVEKVLYEREDGSYSVIVVKDAAAERHTVVGTMPGIAVGQGIKAEGKWEQHKEFGKQFRVLNYEYTLPVTNEGIIRYLASGIIKGLGKKNAEAIVEHFGAEALEVISNAPNRLMEIKGFGRKRVTAIKAIWKEDAARRDLQMHLQSYGISSAYFTRIYSVYGANAADRIKANPYNLASDIKGIGFLMADAIAAKMGIQKDDPKRMLAGITYTFTQVRSNGHVCMPKPDFIRYAAELLDVDEPKAEEALLSAEERFKATIRKSADGTDMVYEPGLLRCEVELPQLIAELSAISHHKGERMLTYDPLPGTLFSDEQLAAVKMAGFAPVSIITGGPGVGKTTVVSEIVRRAKLAGIKTFMAAPTGRAAKRMTETTGATAQTIHRLLRWDPEEKKFVHGVDCPLNCGLLIIDESSMLDIMIATALFRAIRPGTTVVIVGDADQLPSVGPGNVLNDLIDSRVIPVSRLTRIFRQGNGSGIIRAAYAVNTGIMPELKPVPGGPEDFFWIEKEDPEDAADVIRRLVCDRIPKKFHFSPITDIQVLSPMNNGTCGTAELNKRLQELLNGEAKMRFKNGEKFYCLGDKVMQTSNNYDKGVFNGDSGLIKRIDNGKKRFYVEFDSQTIEYEFHEADQLTLAYAVTIHKSQGSEFPAVVIPLLNQHFIMLRRNLLYTGITRAKKLMVLVGSRKAISMAVRNTAAEPRFSLLKERLLQAFAAKGITP
ncbi:MAG: ATP-dependent RecD-like DNA helicase [Lentisphaeria bacterium]|nr:ATP-dependent RecD-like DNA helicase [Lentisphaeria bacterium]